MKSQKLQVGDKIYRMSLLNKGEVLYIFEIIKVTQRYALSKCNSKFNRTIKKDGSVKILTEWPNYVDLLETEILKSQFLKQKYLNSLRSFDFSKLCVNKLFEIINLLNERIDDRTS